MTNGKTESAPLNEPQLLTASGPILLRDFNPKGVLRFSGRKCMTCGNEIMDHWLRPVDDPDLRAEYWCTKDGNSFSQGLSETTWEVPEGFGNALNKSGDK
jgi:hypothetical protein